MNLDISTPDGLQAAVEWQTENVNKIEEGGSWIVPRSGSVIAIHHSTKTAEIVFQLIPEPGIEKVFQAMGWKVKRE